MRSAREILDNLTDALVDNIMSLSDDELRAEIIDAGGDPDAMAAAVKETMDQVLREYDQLIRQADQESENSLADIEPSDSASSA